MFKPNLANLALLNYLYKKWGGVLPEGVASRPYGTGNFSDKFLSARLRVAEGKSGRSLRSKIYIKLA